MRKILLIINLLCIIIASVWSAPGWGGRIGRRIPLPPNFPKNGKVVRVKVVRDSKFLTHLYKLYHKDVSEIERKINQIDTKIIKSWGLSCILQDRIYELEKRYERLTGIWERYLDKGDIKKAKKIREELRKIVKKEGALLRQELKIRNIFEGYERENERYLIRKIKNKIKEEEKIIKKIFEKARKKSNKERRIKILKEKLEGIMQILNDIREIKREVKDKISTLYWNRGREITKVKRVIGKVGRTILGIGKIQIITFLGNTMCNLLKKIKEEEIKLKKEKMKIIRELLQLGGE